MEDNDLRRLISTDLAREARGASVALQFSKATKRQRTRKRLFAVAVVIATLALLSTGFVCAASILPSPGGSTLATLLWAPIVMIGGLIVIAAWIGVSALIEG